MPDEGLSDKAVAVFAFAAYHELSSGEKVVDVVLRDGAGHAADPDAIRELEGKGLARVDGERAVFSDSGKAHLEKALAALREA